MGWNALWKLKIKGMGMRVSAEDVDHAMRLLSSHFGNHLHAFLGKCSVYIL